jgi:transcriptional regulator with GAF, ATPase, and Fis domain
MAKGATATSASRPRTLKSRVDAYERRLIIAALEQAGGNQRRAALALGAPPSTLNEKLKRFGIGVVHHVVDLASLEAGGRSPA